MNNHLKPFSSSIIKSDPLLTNFNYWLYNKWKQLPPEKLSSLTHPYLITPTYEYLNNNIRFAVLNWDTNSWGDNECKKYGIENLDIECLKKIYIEHVNENWDNMGTIWPMYIALRQLSEGQNPDPRLMNKVGFIHSNIALIGKKYNDYGYNSDILPLLIEAIDKQLKLLSPHIILLGIGFGKNGKKDQYIDILSKTFLGPLIDYHPCNGCDTLFEVNFANQNDLIIFGCPHPRGLSYGPIIEYLKNYLLSLSK